MNNDCDLQSSVSWMFAKGIVNSVWVKPSFRNRIVKHGVLNWVIIARLPGGSTTVDLSVDKTGIKSVAVHNSFWSEGKLVIGQAVSL